MEIWLGFLFLVLGAACGGSFGLPSKFVKKDTPWEVLWGPFFFFVTILLPIVVGPLVVEDFTAIYGQDKVVSSALVPMLIFGFLWGLGSMTLGLSFAFIGLSLAYALNYGAQIIFGSMMPMAVFHAKDIPTCHGAVILAGVAVCVAGVVIAARAAMLKEASLSLKEDKAPAGTGAAKKPRMVIGIAIGVVSGILCACYNMALAYAGPVAEAAKAAGNPDYAQAWAQTCLILWGGVLSACGYCAFKLTKNRTWGHLFKPGIGLTLCLALAMAVLHDAAIFFLGLAFPKLGDLAAPVGYPAFMSFAIIIGNLHGFRTGEWKGASRRSVQWIVAAIVVLILGVVVLAQGNAMSERAKKPADAGYMECRNVVADGNAMAQRAKDAVAAPADKTQEVK